MSAPPVEQKEIDIAAIQLSEMAIINSEIADGNYRNVTWRNRLADQVSKALLQQVVTAERITASRIIWREPPIMRYCPQYAPEYNDESVPGADQLRTYPGSEHLWLKDAFFPGKGRHSGRVLAVDTDRASLVMDKPQETKGLFISRWWVRVADDSGEPLVRLQVPR